MQVPAISFANYNNNSQKINFAGYKNFYGGSDAAIDLVYGDMGERAARLGYRLTGDLKKQASEIAKKYREIGYLLPGHPLENPDNMVKYMFRCIAEGFFDCNINFK